MPITLDRYLYLDKTKTKVVEENDPAAAFTLGGPGSVISDEDAKLYGLVEFLRGRNQPKSTQPEANKVKEPGQNKDK